jgi:sugar O-acyltransferase (sialic acid O-acetyltransferase NeuD family)
MPPWKNLPAMPPNPEPVSLLYTMKNIAIFGAGGLGREIAVLIRQLNEVQPIWNLLGFYDDIPFTGLRNGLPYLGDLNDLNALNMAIYLVIGIGNCKAKKKVRENIQNPLVHFPVLIHPSVHIQPYQNIEIGDGSVICQNCVLTTDIQIGSHVLVSPACNIAHDATLANFCSLMYAVNIAGNVGLAECVYLGTNATILQGLVVGAKTIVGAGAVVIRSLPENCTAAGVPASIIKTA